MGYVAMNVRIYPMKEKTMTASRSVVSIDILAHYSIVNYITQPVYAPYGASHAKKYSKATKDDEMKGLSKELYHDFEEWLRVETEVIKEGVAEEAFRENLNDIYDEIRIGNIRWSPAHVLEELAPTAYRRAFLDWLDEYYPNEIEIGGEVWYSYEDEEELLDLFLSDNEATMARCNECEQVCLRTHLKRIDRTDPHSERICKECRDKEKEDKRNARNK